MTRQFAGAAVALLLRPLQHMAPAAEWLRVRQKTDKELAVQVRGNGGPADCIGPALCASIRAAVGEASAREHTGRPLNLDGAHFGLLTLSTGRKTRPPGAQAGVLVATTPVVTHRADLPPMPILETMGGRRNGSTTAKAIGIVALLMAWHANATTLPASTPACVPEGPFGCDATAMTEFAHACAFAHRNLPGRTVAGETIAAVTACGRALPHPAGSGQRAAVLPVYVDLRDGPPSHMGLLFLKDRDGWRAADIAVPPAWTHGGTCSMRVALRWSGRAAPTGLRVKVEHRCHQPLDTAERAAGATSLASLECRTLTYVAAARGWRLASVAAREGPCAGW